MNFGDVAKSVVDKRGAAPERSGSSDHARPARPSHASKVSSSAHKKKSGSSQLTTTGVEDDVLATPKEPLRGPFSLSSQATPSVSRGSLDVQDATAQLPDRPDWSRRHSSTAYFFAKLSGHAEPLTEEPVPSTSTPAVVEPTPSPGTSLNRSTTAPMPARQGSNRFVPVSQSKGWAALRSRLKPVDEKKGKADLQKSLTGHELISEMTLGLLPVMMIKMALMDRDEAGEHRIPILLNYLKMRITDSIFPLHSSHAIFRIELEYGDGLMKWVIYREIRDFYNLHAHYKVSNLGSAISLPNFPKTSLPYYGVLRSQKGLTPEAAKAEFALLQRQQLETYLLKLVRALMFRPEANRLAKFLEISALGLRLAGGGLSGKQGYLTVIGSGASRKRATGFNPLAFKHRHEPKWFLIRESFIAAVDQPDSADLWDVFLFDSGFVLERPKRLYRAGLNKITAPFEHRHEKEDAFAKAQNGGELEKTALNTDSGKDIHRLAVAQDPSAATGVRDDDPDELAQVSQHTFYVRNSERKLKLVARTERQMEQFIASIERMAEKSVWAGPNRFDSFAPIRMNVSAQWLVDGRDYYWRLSEAVSLAKKVIYIHDWWLSPELYLRRPPATNQEWRLDRLLKRKAEEGVKIYVILYKEVAQNFTPVDSLYTKNRLHDLHANILVQRSPDSEARNLLWSHHEKLCVVDEAIAFMGGFDLCYGRWDTPGHTLVDDRDHDYSEMDAAFENGTVDKLDSDECQIWPGKDYANSRASDFFDLNKPEIDMFDRTKVPRQPWHDIGVQLVGQPSRDLCRHFVQRWNYLLRTKNHSRLMPFLIPPTDFTPAEISKLKLAGTCEAQICRSAGPWSLGTSKRIECSIQNAYCKAIQLSEAFVYIENQYFSTSSVAENVAIENHIGDALVSRILRAHNEGMPWKACIIIPLTPGYAMPMDSPDAGNVRMIMEAQSRSIYRGEHSLFARLRREGIDPADYINFFSLRSWGKFKTGQLTTQDIYIHDKIMIVDDRTAIIGSANINERSQRGDRDSELAVIIRDTDMIDGKMAGFPFKVGRFAHTMRMRLMREHVGVDVDGIARDQKDGEPPSSADPKEPPRPWDPDQEEEHGNDDITRHKSARNRYTDDAGEVVEGLKEGTLGLKQAAQYALGGAHPKGASHLGPHDESTKLPKYDRYQPQSDPEPSLEEMVARKVQGHEPSQRGMDPEEPNNDPKEKRGEDWSENELRGMVGRKQESSVISEDHEKSAEMRKKTSSHGPKGFKHFRFPSTTDERDEEGHSDTASFRSRSTSGPGSPLETWEQRAHHRASTSNATRSKPYTIPVPAPHIDPNGFQDPLAPDFYDKVWMQVAARNTEIFRKVFRCTPDDRCLTWMQFKEWDLWEKRHKKPVRDAQSTDPVDPDVNSPMSRVASQEGGAPLTSTFSAASLEPMSAGTTNTFRKASRVKVTDEGFSQEELQAMEDMLSDVNGNLVLYPTKFLESEALAGNNLFTRDRLAPIMIYN